MRTTARFRCEECGFEAGRWLGFCPQCRNGSGLTEVSAAVATSPAGRPATLSSNGTLIRMPTGIEDFDGVLGGGLVPGSLVLVAGEPGVGKSTLLLQAGAGVAGTGRPVLIASAEESVAQIGLRARRLGVADAGIRVVCEADADAVIATAAEADAEVLVVDSIQTMVVAEVGAAPGSVSQVRAAAARLAAFAKHTGTTVVLIGHVTKDGAIAGPKTLEHMVDVVVYLEGDLDRGLRFVRATKNRFGAIDHVGVFTMEERGLLPVEDPSEALVGEWQASVPGTVLFPTLDGRRALLVEVQALVVPSIHGSPRRSAKGIPIARLHQLLAVLDRHAGGDFGRFDVYVSVVGGFQVVEPAIDLPMAVALASSRADRPAGSLGAWGEVGLTGELRSAHGSERRETEARRLGLDRVIAPGGGMRRLEHALTVAGVARERRGAR